MSATTHTEMASGAKATLALQDKLDRLLAKTKPTKREATQQHFRDLYPKLEAHLASGKTLKDILAAFNELVQAKVCARTFNDMLDQERARRDKDGHPICCLACGKPLNNSVQNQALHPRVSDAVSSSANSSQPLTE